MTSFSLRVAAAPRVVFDYLVDPVHRPEWQASLRSVEVLDDGPVRLHTRWVDHTLVGARPRLRIAELRAPGGPDQPGDRPGDRPGTWREIGTWHGVRAELALRFEADGAGTRLSGTVEITGWLRPVLQPLAPLAVVSDLRRAGRILERRHSPS